jgi:dTDP-4-amino-4,6-dideoxygalactose transaminase
MAELAVRGGTPLVSSRLAIRWPVLGDEERRAVLEVLESGVLNGLGAPQLRALETEFAEFVGAEHCLAVNSGTAALHMAVAASGAEPGDEIVTSAFTYPATALAVLHHNAIPVFVDIDPATFNLDVGQIEARIGPRTRALLPVHIHGLPCDMDEIRTVARKHGLVVIEDAAQAHGATYRGAQVGTLGDMAAFSLNGTKNLPCGEGGLFVTNDSRYRDAAASLRALGISREEGEFDPTHPLDHAAESIFAGIGWMYVTQELPAAIARAQLRRLPGFNRNAAANAAVLTARLSELPGVVPPSCPADRTHVYHKYRVRFDPGAMGISIAPSRLRDRILAALKAEGVEAGLWLGKPVPEMEFLTERRGHGRGEYPETTALLEDSIVVGSQSYPIYPQPRALMVQYADAFEKVIASVKELPDPPRAS